MSITDQPISNRAFADGESEMPRELVTKESRIDASRINRAWRTAVDQLMAERTSDGHWTGQLSTSALSTATAVSAMSCVVRSRTVDLADLSADGGVQQSPAQSVTQASADTTTKLLALIRGGCQWLKLAQNSDGGFGDTDLSHSNIATTLLVLAAWQLATEAFTLANQAGDKTKLQDAAPDRAQIAAAWGYVERSGGWKGLQRRYGKDRTFAVPILSNCALAGLVAWDKVPALPFELACLPQSWYRFAQLPVVSYAIPALVAIGQAKFHFRPTRIPGLRAIRKAAIEPSLNILMRMQPASGGYLEAVPLTSFVLMSLASIGRSTHPVAVRGLKFLCESVLPDGSWPIDTNLAAWGTSLSIAAATKHLTLSESPGVEEDSSEDGLNKEEIRGRLPSSFDSSTSHRVESDEFSGKEFARWVSPSCIRWLLSCQHRCRHPFTGAAPGGWGWTNLSGAVPDADDTPAAMIALHLWQQHSGSASATMDQQIVEAVAMGARWLLQLQNRDGGWPTFCRGWGKLPFDRSGTDLTAHALRALALWRNDLDQLPAKSRVKSSQIDRATKLGWNYLAKQQRSDGSWIPLWFGNQDRAEEDNPAYGTARVLLAYAQLGKVSDPAAAKAIEFLVRSQNPDGGWGGGESVAYPSQNSAGEAHQQFGNNARPDRNDHSGPKKFSTLEETSLVLEALLACGGENADRATIMRGVEWTISAVERGWTRVSWPIGFYFAKLWYHERLYPIIYSVAALGAARRSLPALQQVADARIDASIL